MYVAAFLAAVFLAAGAPNAGKSQGYIYTRVGNASDAATKPSPGYLLAGGGADLDEAFAWFCAKANGGDLVVLRASGDDAYNGYIRRVCPSLNSVATLIVSSRDGARADFVSAAVRHAEALFIAGGDQAQYMNLWQGSPLQDEINSAVARGVPIGGTSAGLDVLPEFVYSALNGAVTSAQALTDPFDERVTLARHFLRIPLLAGTIADAHVAARDRLGRDLAFLARITGQDWAGEARGIFLDEKTAALLEPGGQASIVGSGAAYFVRLTGKAENCNPGDPLTLHRASVYRVAARGSFDLLAWSGAGGEAYSVSADNGKLQSTRPGGNVY